MDFGFNQEQELLRATARKFLENECTSEFVRTRMAEPAGVTDDVLGQAGRAGLAGADLPRGVRRRRARLRRPHRADGGDGPRGHAGAVLLDGAAGRADDPRGRLRGPEEGVARQDRAGQAKATLAFTEPNARWDAAGVTVTARESGGKFTLSGTKLFVLDAHLADVLVVVARTREGKRPEEGLSLFLVPSGAKGVEVKLLPTMDQTRKLCEVTFARRRRRRRRAAGGQGRRLGAARPACSTARPWRSAPRCAAAPSACST